MNKIAVVYLRYLKYIFLIPYITILVKKIILSATFINLIVYFKLFNKKSQQKPDFTHMGVSKGEEGGR